GAATTSTRTSPSPGSGASRSANTGGRPHSRISAARTSGRDVGVGKRHVRQLPRVLPLKPEWLVVVALEHRVAQRQREERVRAQLEQPRVVVPGEGGALVVVEAQPGARLAPVAVEDAVGLFPLPPRDGLLRLVPVALDELGVAVDGEEELVQQVLAHLPAPFGYQVKYASIVWNRS